MEKDILEKIFKSVTIVDETKKEPKILEQCDTCGEWFEDVENAEQYHGAVGKKVCIYCIDDFDLEQAFGKYQ
jgi:formylmethanofuran dehydrogenase subunit E